MQHNWTFRTFPPLTRQIPHGPTIEEAPAMHYFRCERCGTENISPATTSYLLGDSPCLGIVEENGHFWAPSYRDVEYCINCNAKRGDGFRWDRPCPGFQPFLVGDLIDLPAPKLTIYERKGDMKNIFDYQKPTPSQTECIRAFRNSFKALYESILALPESRERSLAITKLEEANMWLNKAIVFDQ